MECFIGAPDDPDREHCICSVAEWIESNRDGVCLADILDLLMCGEVKGGGGAAPEWLVRMLPPDSAPKGGA